MHAPWLMIDWLHSVLHHVDKFTAASDEDYKDFLVKLADERAHVNSSEDELGILNPQLL